MQAFDYMIQKWENDIISFKGLFKGSILYKIKLEIVKAAAKGQLLFFQRTFYSGITLIYIVFKFLIEIHL